MDVRYGWAMDEIFDIFCSDDQQKRQLERQHLLRMTDNDFEFYSDRKGPRLMKCFNILETLTTSDVKFAERALGQQKLLDSSLLSVNVGAGASIFAYTSDNSDHGASQSLSKSESISSEELFSQERNEQNRMEWPTLAMMSERYQLSDRASAAVANAVLKDAGLVTDLDKTYVIDKNKLRREREKHRNNTETSVKTK